MDHHRLEVVGHIHQVDPVVAGSRRRSRMRQVAGTLAAGSLDLEGDHPGILAAVGFLLISRRSTTVKRPHLASSSRGFSKGVDGPVGVQQQLRQQGQPPRRERHLLQARP